MRQSVGLGIAALWLLGCPVGSFEGPPPSTFAEVERRYAVQEPVRALAVALEDGRWAFGVAEAEFTEGRAKQRALEGCEQARLQRGLNKPCRIYAVGSRVVWKGPTPQ